MRLSKAKTIDQLSVGDEVNVTGQFSSGFIRDDIGYITKIRVKEIRIYNPEKMVPTKITWWVIIWIKDHKYKGLFGSKQANAINHAMAYCIKLF